MKVLVIGSVYPRFETDTEVPWLRASIAHLKKANAEVEVLAPAYKGLKSHFIDGTCVHRFRYANAALEILTHEEGAPSKMAKKPWLQLLAIPYIISGFFKCLKIAKKFRPDVIHAHWPFPHAFIALGAAKIFKIPLVLNFHGAELLLIRKKKWVKPFLKFAIKHSQGILANSSFTKKRIQEIQNAPVELSPYGTTLGHTALPHVQNEKFKILFVGRHIERKGILYLIESAKFLPREKFEIRIVGEGDLTAILKNQAKELARLYPNAAEIIFTGKLSAEELMNEYQNANAFVLPAIVDSKGDTEGLGVVLIEAMEYGLPVVATDVGGIPDVIIPGESGILVPEKNDEALANAFCALQENPKIVQKILEGAQKHIEENFRWEVIIERQLEFYNSLLKK